MGHSGMGSAAHLEQAAARLGSASSVAVAVHLNPDGDAVGSALGLGLALRRLGKRTAVAIFSPVPDIYRFLPGLELVASGPEALGDPGFDVLAVLDTAEKRRIEPGVLDAVRFETLINIDHHISNPGYGDINWVDPDSASTGAMTAQLLEAMGAGLDPDTAACLYMAHMTDTGCFRYENTDARALEAAARLAAAGAVPGVIVREVYHQRPVPMLRLMGLSLSGLGYDEKLGIVWSWVTREMYAKAGAREYDTEGIVDALQTVKGARAALFARETPEGEIKVSLRSQGELDVGALAAEYGGGGHARAAGAAVPGPIQAAMDVMLETLARRLSAP